MKRIISGKRYDTDTAQYVAEYQNTVDLWDFHHYVEVLYRTGSGAWFLHGQGGPMSKYSRTVAQNQWADGEQITPLSEAEAETWLEVHDVVRELEYYFGAQLVDA